LGYFFIDKVYGKHELITYAVGIDKNGVVKHVEILEYKETYGWQIDNKEWREQFVGKNIESKLTLNDDIKNISGATLSCKHITDGVKRMIALYEIVLRKKA
jgi:Na+-translocating ferredoxin:NAD+ oxidoreductase RnfG subunit